LLLRRYLSHFDAPHFGENSSFVEEKTADNSPLAVLAVIIAAGSGHPLMAG
jgi:hypothetical protein